jgi:regulatory protein
MPSPRRPSEFDEAALYDYAVAALARQMRSVADLKRLLRRRVAAQSDGERLVEAVVGKLKERRYLNDTQYATAYIGYRRENDKFGSQRLRRDLKNKGVHGDIVEKTVNEAYAGVDEEELARQYLARKRLPRPATDRDAARSYRTLLRAGFSRRTIFAILHQWKVDDQLMAALESEGDNSSDASGE